ncbi:MAG TPA: glycosyltransferase family A protein [Rhizomicrobium sp.]
MTAAVSIITPTKNRLALLCRTMDSVRQQSFQAWEHIVVDDGSDDGTEEEVTRRAAADPRVRYIRRTGAKSGANVCRNIGIRESRGDLIVFLDSDDLLRPKCLERRVELMGRNADLDFAVFRAGVFSKTPGDLTRLYHNHFHGDDLLRFLSHECIWEITGPIWRKNFLQEIGGFDETLLRMQDLELHVRAICARGIYICLAEVDHDVSWLYDFSRTSVRHMKDGGFIEASETVRKKLRESVLRSGLLTWSRERAIIGLGFENALSWVRLGNLWQALKSWSLCCRNERVPIHLHIGGLLMLAVFRLTVDVTTPHLDKPTLPVRLVNKWSGWVRFRQEPALVEADQRVGGAESSYGGTNNSKSGKRGTTSP